MMYVEFIQNSKYFLRLIQVLRTAVDTFDFVQITYLGDMLDNFMEDVSLSDKQAVDNIFTEINKIKEIVEEEKL